MKAKFDGIDKAIQGILLDFDGTIIDLTPKWWAPIETSFQDISGEVPEELLRKNVTEIMKDVPQKPSRFYLLKVIWTIGRMGGLSRWETIRFIRMVRIRFSQSKYINQFFPGVEGLLSDWIDHGLKLAIVTSAGMDEIIEARKQLPILSKIPTVSRDDVMELKPHPEPVFKALDILKLSPSQAVFCGDFRTDIEAGKNAGVWTIALSGVVPDVSEPGLSSVNPDLLVRYLTDLKFIYVD